MELIVEDNYDGVSLTAANMILSTIKDNPYAVLGLTSGNSPMGLYKELVRNHLSGMIDLSHVRFFVLEEYLGVGPDDPRSLYAWLDRTLFTPCRISASHIFRLRGEDPEPQINCQAYEECILSQGGFDLIVEGIGTNAHIGFNEPGAQADTRTRIVLLTPSTKEYNYNYWNFPVPSHGMTAGIATMLEAKKILLLSSGKNKKTALMKAFANDITPDYPASYLQQADQLTVIADRESASLLSNLISCKGD